MRLVDRRTIGRGRSRTWTLILGLALVVLAPLAVEAAKTPSASDQMKFGVQMARRGLWSEALFRFKAADRLEPNNAKTLNNMAVAYEAVGQFENALEYYKKALRAAPGNGDLKKNYARFVEFYQGYRPEGDEEPEDSTSAEDDGPGRA